MEDRNQIVKTKYGYWELKHKPNINELSEYYEKKYYQEAKGSYEYAYSKEEIQNIKNQIESKYEIIIQKLDSDFGCNRNRDDENNMQLSLIDIGCGEGWVLDYFLQKGWRVKGLDYSNTGCLRFNPNCSHYIELGDIFDTLSSIINETNERFHVIWLGNVLEHVLNPLDLLQKCFEIAHQFTILVIEVPNDFSVVHQYFCMCLAIQ